MDGDIKVSKVEDINDYQIRKINEEDNEIYLEISNDDNKFQHHDSD